MRSRLWASAPAVSPDSWARGARWLANPKPSRVARRPGAVKVTIPHPQLPTRLRQPGVVDYPPPRACLVVGVRLQSRAGLLTYLLDVAIRTRRVTWPVLSQ